MNQNEKLARYSALTFPLEPELGRRVMPVREIMALAPGSVIKLSQPIGSKIDVHVGGALFGTADLVSLGGPLALRFASFTANEPGDAEKGRG